jgi:allantoate deiminase
MTVSVDHAGNLRGLYPAGAVNAGRLIVASHLDTVPRAGAFDGILGVMLGIVLIEALDGRCMNFEIEVIGFSEEEGVRFGVPFIGSLAMVGDADDALLARQDSAGIAVKEAIVAFGLDPARVGEAATQALAYLEFHIEQGPVLEGLNLPLGIVEAIAGQSRLDVVFEGQANHAGTTPMALRRDALAGASEWIGEVEAEALATDGLVATVGQVHVSPGAGNVIAGTARASLDVRHSSDEIRLDALGRILDHASKIAARRGLTVSWTLCVDQPAVAMNPSLVKLLDRAVSDAGFAIHHMTSGAGHDAMIAARRMPAAMLFLRSPGGISHHPDETALEGDVAAAIETGMRFLANMEDHAKSGTHT